MKRVPVFRMRKSLFLSGTHSAQPLQQETSSYPTNYRSSSVLASLMRMRSQFQRIRNVQQQQAVAIALARRDSRGPARKPPSSSADAVLPAEVVHSVAATGQGSSDDIVESSSMTFLQTGVFLCTEALQLLSKEVRANEALSDVPSNTAAYAVEIGKLVGVAALFGASTTFPRVESALQWARENAEVLQSPRQVMSLCGPLLNLNDGPTRGVHFVLSVLYEPLLLALQNVNACVVETTASTAQGGMASGGGGGGATHLSQQQQLVALTSAFAMVAKWSVFRRSTEQDVTEPLTESKGYAPSESTMQWEFSRMLKIAEASVAALRRYAGISSSHGADEASVGFALAGVDDVVSWLECLHGLEKLCAAVAAAGGFAGEKKDEYLQRLVVCQKVLHPLIQRVLEGVPCGSAAQSSRGVAGATALTATIANTRVQDVVGLVQLGLQKSAEPRHCELVLAHGLRIMPCALASASVKELCSMTQVVNRVRLQRPEALSAPFLNTLLSALRPCLFLLLETEVFQLRPLDCSTLLSQLSRWEAVPGVVLNADVVELLLKHFLMQMHVVNASHMVPFLQALVRLERARRQVNRGTTKGETSDTDPALGQEEDDGLLEIALAHDLAWAPYSEEQGTALLKERQSGQTSVVRYRFGSTSRVAAQCALRAGILATSSATGKVPESPAAGSDGIPDATSTSLMVDASTPRLSALDASNLLSCFVQLSAQQCLHFFLQIEPLLKMELQGSSGSAYSAIQIRVAIQEAVGRFVQYASSVRATSASHHSSGFVNTRIEEEAAVGLQRATALLREVSHGTTELVQSADRPRDLVKACSLLRYQLNSQPSLQQRKARRARAQVALTTKRKTPAETLQARRNASSQRRSRRNGQVGDTFVRQMTRLAPESNGHELGVLASAASSFCRAGVLSPASAQEVFETLWTRCAADLSSRREDEWTSRDGDSPALDLQDCKRIMDASRSLASVTSGVSPWGTVPSPVGFFDTFTSSCQALVNDSLSTTRGSSKLSFRDAEEARGTPSALPEAVTQLRRVTDLGRSVVSFAALFVAAARDPGGKASWHEAFARAVQAYLEMLHKAVTVYAAEATLPAASVPTVDAEGPSPVPLELLCMTAHVAAQIHRLLHRGDAIASVDRATSAFSAAATELQLGDDGDTVGKLPSVGTEGTDAVAPLMTETLADEEHDTPSLHFITPTKLSTADRILRDVMGTLGDTIAILAKEKRPAKLTTEAEGSPPDCLSGGMDRSGSYVGDPLAVHAHTLVQDPKHLLILLQAFEVMQYPHPEMVYSLLPELRDCAARLNPLQLSLLIRAVMQLGAWNTRLLHVLANAVNEKMKECGLRQCYSLLRALCRAGCVSPDTYADLRSPHLVDWQTECNGGSRHSQVANMIQKPLQQLAEKALARLDSLVCTEAAFMSLARTAPVGDLVAVVNALRFFHVPPPPTYDAYVVLAIHRLVLSSPSLPLREHVQHTIALLGAVPLLRRAEQQRVSAEAVWEGLRRSCMSTFSGAAGEASEGIISNTFSLHICWELTRCAALHSLLYGQKATRSFYAPLKSADHKLTGHSLSETTLKCLRSLVLAHMAALPSGATPSCPELNTASRAALSRYALNSLPSLARGDRALQAFLCAPLKLVDWILGEEFSTLTPRVATAVPLALSKHYARLVACLLRTDVWLPGYNLEDDQRLATLEAPLLAALRRLWKAAHFHDILRDTPESFSTEELLVLAAAALRVSRLAAETTDFHVDYAVAIDHLCGEAATWRVPAAVDAWMLFALPMVMMRDAAMTTENLSDEEEKLFKVLVTSGDTLVTAFAHAQVSWSSRAAPLLPELLRLFHGPGQLDVAILQSEAAFKDAWSPLYADLRCRSNTTDANDTRRRFVKLYDELLEYFITRVAESPVGSATGLPNANRA